MQLNEQFIRSTFTNISITKKLPSSLTFSIDSRTIRPGQIFVAIKGMRVDGHDFISEAIQKGAAGIIISRKIRHIDTVSVITVEDTLAFIQALSYEWRNTFSIPIVAVTGSTGKTSTKELIAHILRQKYKTFASYGNQNTRIGLSLNILNMPRDTEYAVFELGVSKRGEMKQLVSLLKPTNAVITNVGHSHMQGLGSVNDIALEKRDIFHSFSPEHIGVVNGDLPIVSQVSYSHPVVKFGLKTTNQIQARKVKVIDNKVHFILKIYQQKYEVSLPHSHIAQVENVCAAAAVAHLLNIGDNTIIKAISSMKPVAERFECKKLTRYTGELIDDSYNANPESMKAALLAFESIKTERDKIAVIGDMLELGVDTPFWHRQIGRFLRKAPSVKKCILVGMHVSHLKKTLPLGVQSQIVADWQEAIELLKKELTQDSLVLVKGSRGIGLNNLVSHFTQ